MSGRGIYQNATLLEKEDLNLHEIMEPDQETTRKSATAAPRKLKQHDTRFPAAPAIKKSQAEQRNMMLDLIEKGEVLEANIRTILGKDSPRDANM